MFGGTNKQNAYDRMLKSLDPDKFIAWLDDDKNVIRYDKISKFTDPKEMLERVNAVAHFHPIHPDDLKVTKYAIVEKQECWKNYRYLTEIVDLRR